MKGRPFVAVAADMIEGIIVTNQLSGPDALRVRGALWAALGFSVAASEAPGAGRSLRVMRSSDVEQQVLAFPGRNDLQVRVVLRLLNGRVGLHEALTDDLVQRDATT